MAWAFGYGVGTEKERRTQGAAIRARRVAFGIASRPARSPPRCRRRGTEEIAQTQSRRDRRRRSARAQAAREERWQQAPIQGSLAPRPGSPVLLGRGAGGVGGNPVGRRHRLGG